MRGASARKKAFEIALVFFGADLNMIAARQQLELKANRAQVFEAGFEALDRAAHERQRAGDRLEVDVVLEQRADEALEGPRVLAERGVFELDHVDPLQQSLALDQPLDFAACETRGRRAA